MDDQTALATFGGKNEEAANRAFAHLSEKSRRDLYVCLTRDFGDSLIPDDRQNVIQNTFVNIWKARSRFKNQGIAGWFGLLRTTAYRAAIDYLRERSPIPVDPNILEDEEKDYHRENEIIESLANAIQAGRLLDCANILWLGLDPSLPPEIHTRQLLVAQRYYLQGESFEEILNWLPPLSPDEPAPTRETLDDWLSHPGVWRYLAYNELYYSNDRLACLLLGLEGSCSSDTLDKLMRQVFAANQAENGPDGKTAMEIAIILWRYRNGLLLEQIARREDCRYTSEEIRGLLDRLTARMPFSRKMVHLLSCLRPAQPAKVRAALGARGLWQRLAFQYRYLEFLPHRDIRERTQPAAQHVDYDVTLATLNGWLGNGKLLAQLAAYYAAHGGSENDG